MKNPPLQTKDLEAGERKTFKTFKGSKQAPKEHFLKSPKTVDTFYFLASPNKEDYKELKYGKASITVKPR